MSVMEKSLEQEYTVSLKKIESPIIKWFRRAENQNCIWYSLVHM